MQVGSHIQADPFGKVKQMIQDQEAAHSVIAFYIKVKVKVVIICLVNKKVRPGVRPDVRAAPVSSEACVRPRVRYFMTLWPATRKAPGIKTASARLETSKSSVSYRQSHHPERAKMRKSPFEALVL